MIIRIVIVILVFANCSCSSPSEPILPGETQVGAKTFGCRVNGIPWVPKAGGAGQDGFPLLGGLSYPDSFRVTLEITARNIPAKEAIFIFVGSVKGPGTYPLTQHLGALSFIRNNKVYGLLSGHLVLTRMDSLVIAGTFNFTSSNGIDTLRITEGRFDI